MSMWSDTVAAVREAGPVKFDASISLGSVLAAIGFIISAAVAWAAMEAALDEQARRQDAMEILANALDARVRDLEISRAGDRADMRAMQATLLEIKTGIDRLSERP